MTEATYGDNHRAEINWLFKNESQFDYLSLDRELQRQPSHVLCGPQYHVDSSSNVSIDVAVLYFDTINSEERTLRNFFLIGSVPKIGVVARKSSSIDYYVHGDTIANGHLNTAYSGQGYGTPIELVQADILQREADQHGLITWVITDQNYKFLYAAEQDYSKKRTNDNRIKLEEARLEHERLKSIYDRFGGTLEPDQYTPKYHVQFTPAIPPSRSIDEVNECYLQRYDTHATASNTLLYLNTEEKEFIRVKRIHEVMEMLRDASK